MRNQSSAPDDSAIGKRRPAGWWVSLLVLVLLLAAVEMGLRLIDFDPNPNPRWRYSSDYGWLADADGYHAVDAIRDNGFRSRAWLGDCSAERTVAVIGDSFAFAAAVPYAQSFAGRVETALSEASGQPWCVVNLSNGDWGNVQQWRALDTVFAKQAPRAVIWQIFAFNDFCNTAPALRDTCSLQDHFRPYLRAPALQEAGQGPDVASACGHSRLWCWIKTVKIGFERRQQGVDPKVTRSVNQYYRSHAQAMGSPVAGAFAGYLAEPHQTPLLRTAWAQWEGVLTGISHYLTGRNIPSVALLLPYARSAAEHRDAFVQHHAKRHLDPDYGEQRVARLLRGQRLNVVDFAAEMQRKSLGADQMFRLPRDSHLSAAGHQAVAATLVEALRSQLEIP